MRLHPLLLRPRACLFFVLVFGMVCLNKAEAKIGPEFKSPTLGTTLETKAFVPSGTKNDASLSIAVYAYNGRWNTPGAPTPERMREYLLDLGLGVVMLDYGKHQKAVMPELWRDGQALMNKKFFWACNRAMSIKTQELFVVPEGFRLRKDVHFFTSPDNDLQVNAWLLHPIQSPRPFPLAIRYNKSGEWAGSMLAGTEFRGFARAWIGHPFNFNRSRGIFPSDRETHEKGLAYGRSAVRTLRARAGEFSIDPDRFVLFGSSKHGNMSVWVGVTSDEPAEDPKWGGLHHNTSSAVQCVVAKATWGFSEFWQDDGAPKFHEWMGYTGSGTPSQDWLVKRSWTSHLSKQAPPMAIGQAHGGSWRKAQVTRLIKSLDELDVPFIQSVDKQLPAYQKFRRDRLHRFVETHLQ